MMTAQSQRAPLGGRSSEIFNLVSRSATEEQWAEWLRVPLEHAAVIGDLNLFLAILRAGTEIRGGWRGCFGRTLLEAAVYGGSMGIVSFLLTSGSRQDVNIVCPFSGRPPLLSAIKRDNAAIARRLVLAGADVNSARGRNDTALHMAAERGQKELVNDLLLAGADVTSRRTTLEGETALHIAAKKGYVGIAMALLLKGADKDEADLQGDTPLTHAIRSDHIAVVETLLAAGADVGITGPPLDIAVGPAFNLAAHMGHDAILKAMIRNKVATEAYIASIEVALPWAVFGNQPRTIDVLVEAGVDVETSMDTTSTPLLHAADRGHFNAMHALLRHGADVDARDQTGSTALHLVCSQKRRGCGAVVAHLLRRGANETAMDGGGCVPATRLDLPPPEHFAALLLQTEVECVRMMLAHAPADRAWRRRGWLAILHSRAERARHLEIGHDDYRETELPRSEQSDVGVDGPQQGNCSRTMEEDLAGVVSMLTEQASKDVFRNTVSFL
ncbi:unnamed protein product [Scytosiphon promiscuus]